MRDKRIRFDDQLSNRKKKTEEPAEEMFSDVSEMFSRSNSGRYSSWHDSQSEGSRYRHGKAIKEGHDNILREKFYQQELRDTHEVEREINTLEQRRDLEFQIKENNQYHDTLQAIINLFPKAKH